ncbi:MAG: monovalent cation/H(+) antiporter subunit G [Gammaproteobacteria bacterium]|jgi:multicomponent Na+:H+ antiporter subunit G
MAGMLDSLSWILLLLGGFLGITGAVGLFRFPDFYTRLHAASVTDTLCAGFIVLGLMLQAPDAMMVIKLLLILLILAYTSPTAAHALAKAAMHSGLQPLLSDTPDAPVAAAALQGTGQAEPQSEASFDEPGAGPDQEQRSSAGEGQGRKPGEEFGEGESTLTP